MATNINNGMCRCCASEGTYKHLSSEYQWMGETEVYADMLRDCFDINISMNEDGNDGGICEVCITQLRNAANFKKQVLHTEERFKNRLASGLLKNSIIKVEVNALEYDNNSEDNNLSEDFSTSEYMVPIKSESDEGKSKKRTRATTSRAKKPKVEEAESSTKSLRYIYKGTSEVKSKSVKTATLTLNCESTEVEKHRANIRTILQCSNATPIRCYGGTGYACSFCSSEFPDPSHLKIHTLEFHEEKQRLKFMQDQEMYTYVVKLDITSLQCTLCNEYIDTVEDLIEHLITIHNIIMNTDIKNQIVPFKFEDQTLRCFMCLNVFNRFKSLLQHMNTHYRNHICDVCEAGFVSKGMLSSHRRGHKNGDFPCKYCKNVYDTQQKRKVHEKIVHLQYNKLYKCGFCYEKFKCYWTKEQHIAKVHGVAPQELKCEACNKIFSDARALKTHTRRDHLLERPHKCKYCDMSFYKKNDLSNHEVKHTKVTPFQCEVCMKCYGRKKTLTEHMKIHKNDRRLDSIAAGVLCKNVAGEFI